MSEVNHYFLPNTDEALGSLISTDSINTQIRVLLLVDCVRKNELINPACVED